MSEVVSLHKHPLNKAVVIAGLGFFVDAFDLLLFNVLRVPSLKDIGLSGDELTRAGEFLLSMQMLGMIAGGIISGIIGDRRGRISVLFGSILLYSAANLANAWVQDVNTYAVIRFLAGLGLAGELGAGVTLVSESMTPTHRGYGTILVATLGALGAIAAGLAGDLLPWRITYIVAGVAGLFLLLLRVRTMEPAMYQQARQRKGVPRGSFRLLFSTPQRALRYLGFILLGIPVWSSVGISLYLSPELAKIHGIEGLRPATCFILFQVGIATGDLTSGIISQRIRSRKRVLFSFMAFAVLASAGYLFCFEYGLQTVWVKVASLLLGLGCGYMSVFVTTATESFGTNLRVTVSATVTNFMRGAVTILIPLRIWLEKSFSLTMTGSLLVVGVLVFVPALFSVSRLRETYACPLDYVEE